MEPTGQLVAVDQRNGQQHDTQHHVVHEGRHADCAESRAQQAQDQSASCDPEGPAFAARQGDAADDCRRRRGNKGVGQPDRRSRRQAEAEQRTGTGCQNAGHCKGAEQDGAHLYTGHQGCAAVAADRDQVAPYAGPRDHPLGDQDDADGQQAAQRKDFAQPLIHGLDHIHALKADGFVAGGDE